MQFNAIGCRDHFILGLPSETHPNMDEKSDNDEGFRPSAVNPFNEGLNGSHYERL